MTLGGLIVFALVAAVIVIGWQVRSNKKKIDELDEMLGPRRG